MGDTFTPAANGHAAGKNGQELGLENELTLLDCIKTEGWVREHEASLITGMSRYMVGKISRRLAEKGHIYRNQIKNLSQIRTEKQKPNCRERFEGNAGFFLRLTAAGADRVDGKSGKDIKIPASWRHHAMAIQTLHFLAKNLGCSFETEASTRHRVQSGRIPDGRLVSDRAKYYFEQEHTKKSGKYLGKQTENITQLAKDGAICHIAYPFPASICGGVSHETRQTNSIRHKWGSSPAPCIKLVRCHFDSLLAYQNMRVSRFEVIELPAMVSTAASKKNQPGVTDQIMGFKWTMTEHRRQYGEPRHIDAILKHCDEIHFEGTFTGAVTGDDYHLLKESGGCIYAQGYGDEQTFDEFVRLQQKKTERQAGNDVRLCASNAEFIRLQKEIEGQTETEINEIDLTGLE